MDSVAALFAGYGPKYAAIHDMIPMIGGKSYYEAFSLRRQ